MVKCENCKAELDASSVFENEWEDYDMVICEECDEKYKFIGSKCILAKKEMV